MGAANAKAGASSFQQIKSVSKSLNGQSKNIPIGFENSSHQQSSPGFNDKTLRFVEEILVVWLDGSLEKLNESTEKSLSQVRRISNILKTFSDLEKCFQFISSIRNEKIFFIVSGSLGPQIVPRIEKLDQVHSIYIFCGNKANHEQWTKAHKKVRSLHTQIRELCETIKYHIRQYDKSLTSINILPASATVQLNAASQEFITYQVMKSILLDLRYDKNSRQEFMKYARDFYLENDYQLKLINTLGEDYDLHSPIWRYTRRCSLYSMLRRAFHMQDSEIIYKLAFFVRDLHRDIKKSYLQVHNHQHRPISVYRSTKMTNEMFVHMEKNYEGLLAFNDFLLTTLERSMALKFANSLRGDPNAVAIIYKIDIDPVTSTIPYISLNNLSYLSDTEGEILFSMNTIFRINEIEKLNDRLYEVTLNPVSKKDEQIHKLVDCMQKLTANLPLWYKLSKILIDTHQYDQVESLYKHLFSETDQQNGEERAFLQHELGYLEELKNNLPEATRYYKQAIEAYHKTVPQTHPALATTYANLASVLQKQGDLKGALSFYKEASKSAKPHEVDSIVYSNYIATVLQAQGKHLEAQQVYERSEQTLLRDFVSSPSVLANTYHHMAGLFYSIRDYSKAVNYYEKALAIYEKAPSENQTTLASAYFNAATACQGLQDYDKAIQYAEKAAEIARLIFGSDHWETKDNLAYLEQLRGNDLTVKL